MIESPNAGIQDLKDEHEKSVDDESPKRTEFVHLGTTALNQSQLIIESWIEKAKKANLIAQQAKFALQQITIIGRHDDSIEVTISGPATHELTMGVGNGI